MFVVDLDTPYLAQDGTVRTFIRYPNPQYCFHRCAEDKNGHNVYSRLLEDGTVYGTDNGRCTGTNHDYSHPTNLVRDDIEEVFVIATN